MKNSVNILKKVHLSCDWIKFSENTFYYLNLGVHFAKKLTMSKSKNIIGRSEKIDLPDLKLVKVKAKVDTGAFGCSIHCSEMEFVERDGCRMIRIVPLQRKKDQKNRESFYFQLIEKKVVKSSIGKKEVRPVIKLRVSIFGEIREVEFSLTDRSDMKYPILLGREFLRGKYLVDVSKINLSEKQK